MSVVLDKRRAGVLLHISSLPNKHALGDFSAARRFIDFLVSSGISVWQVLPLGPTHKDLSPYLCTSSFAGNPAFINLEWLQQHGWLSLPVNSEVSCDNNDYRRSCMQLSLQGFTANAGSSWQQQFQEFMHSQQHWLDDFALFAAIGLKQASAWMHWPQPLRDRQPQALQQAKQQLAADIEQIQFEQFIFYQQWFEIKRYANDNGVLILGDLPLYLAHDSAEIWAKREYFKVDETGDAKVVAGVPPDYFSSTGQTWGNPVYDWPRLQADGFTWWVQRLTTQLQQCDLLRIDHFRGLQAYWEIPVEAESAVQGHWQDCPGVELLETVQQTLGELPLVAEDLGFITPQVHALRDHFELPGMKVMQFAFDGSIDNPYLLRHHVQNCVVYTGTHDNDTSLGWYQQLDEHTRNIVDHELGAVVDKPLSMPWSLIDYTLSSPARLVVLPMQDILSLGSDSRLNTPGTIDGNWRWQCHWQQLDSTIAQYLHERLEVHQRLVRVCR